LLLASPALKPLSTPSVSRGPFSSPERREVVLCLFLAAVTLILYNPVNRHDFINFDDDHYITQNPHIRGLTIENIRWAFTSTAEANWHPLTWISHEIDYQLFHLHAGGHHFISLLFHAANAILLFLLLSRGTGRVWPSLMVAALFAVHPLNVESVAWAAERKNVLCTFFFLLNLWAYGWYVRRPNVGRYLVVAALFAMGLMAKPMVITLPFVLLLLDYWPLNRIRNSSNATATSETPQVSFGKLALEKLPLLALSAASAWITMIVQRGAMRTTQEFTFAVRLKNSVVAYCMYLWKALWPSQLAVLYAHPGNSLAVWKIAVSIAVLLAITGVVLCYRPRRYLLTGWLWFLGTLVPVIGVVQVGFQSMADRYAYIPLIGVFVMAVWTASDLAQHWKLKPAWSAVAAVVILLALSWTARRQLGYWDSGIELWTHTLQVNPDNFIAHDNLGDALLVQGKRDEAYAQFQLAADVTPRDPWCHGNMGAYLQERGRLPEAIEQYQLTIQLSRDPFMLALTYANMGSAYRDLGMENDALASYNEAIRINPNQFNAYFGRGELFEKQGKLTDAIRDFSKSLDLQPTAQGYLVLGQALAQAGRRDEARTAFEQAIKTSPDSKEAQQAAVALGR
jgi:protein O-mannosyl-transferase